ncbi:hypothetical protein F4809DRAFT_596147 [Biscogniauxia mediterranea]|nr:hypothetical protein F4809DRAFT_596147 [Biscogniauxia mediterranea]
MQKALPATAAAAAADAACLLLFTLPYFLHESAPIYHPTQPDLCIPVLIYFIPSSSLLTYTHTASHKYLSLPICLFLYLLVVFNYLLLPSRVPPRALTYTYPSTPPPPLLRCRSRVSQFYLCLYLVLDPHGAIALLSRTSCCLLTPLLTSPD